jgi:hypothetical protein
MGLTPACAREIAIEAEEMITTRAGVTWDNRGLYLVLLVLAVPRVAAFGWWLAAPDRWDVTFRSVVVPLIGILLLPWTTLMFVVVAPSGHVELTDWWWLMAGVAADVIPLASSAISRTGADHAR